MKGQRLKNSSNIDHVSKQQRLSSHGLFLAIWNNWHVQNVKWISTNLFWNHDVSCWPKVATSFSQPHTNCFFVMKNMNVDVGVWRVGHVFQIMSPILFSCLYWLIPPIVAIFSNNEISIGHRVFPCSSSSLLPSDAVWVLFSHDSHPFLMSNASSLWTHDSTNGNE